MTAMPSKNNPDLTRKDFLAVVGKGALAVSGLLGLFGLLRYLGYQPDPAPQTVFDLGLADNYPPDSRTVIPEAQAVLLRGERDFSALSLVCPHLGCQVELAADGFACPCHGSRFTSTGIVQNSPADRPLRPLRLEQTADGRLILYTGPV